MATLGNVPAEAYTNTVKDSFSGNGSATAFTMSLPTVTNDVRVVVENVIQDPTVAYSVSGTTLTFTSAPPTGTNNIYVVHLGPAVMTTVPPAEIADATTFASSLTVQGAFTSPGIDDNGNATAITIDSSENVGIGATSPNTLLHLSTTAGTQLRLTAAANNYAYLEFGDTDDEDVGRVQYSNINNSMSFHTNAAERMRIDSSGHLMVGTTAQEPSVSNDDSGFSVRPVGTASISRTGGPTIDLNRKASDGLIAVFRKDGTEVGSVGTQGSRLSIGSGDVNLNFNASANSMYPISDPTAGTLSSGIVDLGAALATFKDLYLSGGVYLGGTGSANKLDDYETGSWTPALNSGSLNIASAKYTKVGRLVTLNLDASVATGGGSQITNAPFTAGNTVATPIFTSVQNFNSSRTVPTIIIGGGSPTMYFRDIGDNVSWLAMPLTTGASISFSFTYMTT